MVAPVEVLTEVAALTVSTAVLLDDQLTVRPERILPPPSRGTAVRICEPPSTIGVVGDDSDSVATGAAVTVSNALPVLPSLVAIILAVPAETGVTRPVDDTVATAVLSELQTMERPVSVLPFESSSVAVACVV